MPPEMIRRIRLPWSTGRPWEEGNKLISHYQLRESQARWRETPKEASERHFRVKYRKNTGTRWHRYEHYSPVTRTSTSPWADFVHLGHAAEIMPYLDNIPSEKDMQWTCPRATRLADQSRIRHRMVLLS